ncbi:MAG TPA: 30S ribosome-binding factor RbfA [Polyangia bacterium]|jgi:ribosome-binding factor A|nr:30S ribosome-binding factor RbfA [Polyangia bacterium]
MSQRTEMIAGEVRAVVGEVIARQEIKDPRVRGAGLITVTHVRLSGDLRHACALFTVHGAGEAELARVREGLDHASSYFRHAIGRRLRTKVTPHLTFEIDRVFAQASRVEELLREVAATTAVSATEAGPDADADADPDGAPPGPAEAAAPGDKLT